MKDFDDDSPKLAAINFRDFVNDLQRTLDKRGVEGHYLFAIADDDATPQGIVSTHTSRYHMSFMDRLSIVGHLLAQLATDADDDMKPKITSLLRQYYELAGISTLERQSVAKRALN